MDFNHVTQDEREALYNEVWTDHFYFALYIPIFCSIEYIT